MPVDPSPSPLRSSPQLHADLIFDIGLHKGDDSRYYLDSGYRVVGVDANPLLVSHCAERFCDELRSGAITLINAGVLQSAGEFTFFRNLNNPAWSSFLPERGQTGGHYETIPIRCTTMHDLVSEFGRPYFIKTDVEGADLEVISTLSRSTAPPFISCELSPFTDILAFLVSIGYQEFKLVNGETFTSSGPIFDHEFGWRALRKLGRLVPPVKRMLQFVPGDLHRKAEFDPPPAPVTPGVCSSGPFGDAAFGHWLDHAETKLRLDKLIAQYKRYGQEANFWWDIHARLPHTGS